SASGGLTLFLKGTYNYPTFHCQPVPDPHLRKGVIPEAFKARHEQLVSIRNELEKLSITQAWSLRETDLYDYQRKLDKIDESRVDGNWLDDEGKAAEVYVKRKLL
ncbi:DUF2408 domain-containing protein, partial [Escherichia coli]|nr:DUF2408 domain-containing protein [Escherichia coli]